MSHARDCLDKIAGLAKWQSEVIEHWVWALSARVSRWLTAVASGTGMRIADAARAL